MQDRYEIDKAMSSSTEPETGNVIRLQQSAKVHQLIIQEQIGLHIIQTIETL